MDITQRNGNYPVPPGASSILGVEFSGNIAEVGPNTFDFKIGDEVLGLVGGVSSQLYISDRIQFDVVGMSGLLCGVCRLLGETYHPETKSFDLGGGSQHS
jgi:NADPH:quinone reductase-like Zn-dependent oxidoreductase